jgi:hypothetical protein
MPYTEQEKIKFENILFNGKYANIRDVQNMNPADKKRLKEIFDQKIAFEAVLNLSN